MERERTSHESFGIIKFSRVNGHQRFYGSEIAQDSYIELTLHNSEIETDLTGQHFYDNGVPIVRLRMSSGQFSELITSLNIGSGVPCTLEMINGKKVENLPETENRKEYVLRKFKERMKEFADRIRSNQKETIEIVKKKTLSKEDVRVLSQNLEYLTTEITANIPFFQECFQEDMDKIVNEAKMEIENTMLHKITTVGLKHIELNNGDFNKKEIE